MKRKQRIVNLCAAILFALAGAMAATGCFVVRFGGTELWGAASKLAVVLKTVESQYIGEYDIEELTDAAMSGVIDALDDRWSYYMNAEEYESYLDLSANRYQGIGVTIQKDEATGGFLIVGLEKDGPAAKAGVQVGEIVLAVDGVSVVGGETSDMRSLIQADFGEMAVLTLLTEAGYEREVSVSCEVVYTDPVSYEMLPGNVGYVDIENFEEGCADSAIAAIDELTAQGARALVFDVRNNPGGRVTELVELLDYLLPEGDVFVRIDKDGNETVETSDAEHIELPMAVLMNGDSYSAAEFFPAALSEYGVAVTVGEPTTGKGRSQINIPLSDGSAVHISKYAYLTPQRVDLSVQGGLQPDVPAELDEEQQTLYISGELSPADDAQVTAAVGALMLDAE